MPHVCLFVCMFGHASPAEGAALSSAMHTHRHTVRRTWKLVANIYFYSKSIVCLFDFLILCFFGCIAEHCQQALKNPPKKTLARWSSEVQSSPAVHRIAQMTMHKVDIVQGSYGDSGQTNKQTDSSADANRTANEPSADAKEVMTVEVVDVSFDK